MTASDKLKLSHSATESLPDDSHTLPAGLTCGSGKATGMNLLISSPPAFPAKGPVLPENDSVLPTTAPPSSGKLSALPKPPSQRGGCLKMFQGSLAFAEDKTSTRSFTPYGTVGLLSDGGLWTANQWEGVTCTEEPECRNGGAASSLSAVLQSRVSPKYFLSPKAAAGILRRAEKRGRTLPPALEAVLKDLASTWQGEVEKTT